MCRQPLDFGVRRSEASVYDGPESATKPRHEDGSQGGLRVLEFLNSQFPARGREQARGVQPKLQQDRGQLARLGLELAPQGRCPTLEETACRPGSDSRHTFAIRHHEAPPAADTVGNSSFFGRERAIGMASTVISATDMSRSRANNWKVV